MKKIISLIFASIMVLSLLAVSVSAIDMKFDEESVEGAKIACIDFLDFSAENNAWAKQSENGDWTLDEDVDNAWDEENDWLPKQAYVSTNKTYGYPKYTNGKLGWALTDNGEVLHLEATSSSAVPGMTFVLDADHSNIKLGKETSGNMEYCKIRIRNYSSAKQFTFGYMTSNINNGQSFFDETVTDVPVQSNSSEWVTYTFSVCEYNSNTNYGDKMKKDADGIPQSRWSAWLSNILVFPFGYNVTDGTGAYEGASIDIDYIVFGSLDYVTSYQSALEQKEAAVSSIKIVKEPTQKTFYVGDTINIEGLEVEATYKDGTKETLESTNIIYNFDNASDSSTVTLKYGDAVASYNVKVIGLTGIEVETLPESLTYDKVSVTNGFSPSELTVKVNHADGTSAVVGLNAVKLEYDFSELGENIVTVNYHGVTCTFVVDIINVVGIRVDPLENVKFGKEIAEGDLSITCVYSDNTEKSLSDAKINATVEVECDTKVAGTTDLTVKVSNITYEIDCTFTTTATMEEPASIELNTDLVEKEYDVDAQFSKENLGVLFKYADGTTAVVDSDYYRVRYDFSSPGVKTVTVTDTTFGKSATFDVTVKGEVAPSTTKTPETTKKVEPKDNGGSGTVVIIIVVAVVVVAAVVVVVLLVSKKKKAAPVAQESTETTEETKE